MYKPDAISFELTS